MQKGRGQEHGRDRTVSRREKETDKGKCVYREEIILNSDTDKISEKKEASEREI